MERNLLFPPRKVILGFLVKIKLIFFNFSLDKPKRDVVNVETTGLRLPARIFYYIAIIFFYELLRIK